MPSVRQCAKCKANWPVLPDFRSCPRCDVACVTKHGTPDHSAVEAKKLARKWRAAHVFKERDKERAERGVATPEQIGRLEARVLLSLDRRAAA